MRICENGVYRDMTQAEQAAAEAMKAAAEREYWDTVTYDDAVNARIRRRYSQSQEFALLRQRGEKPEEYQAYYAYCEECKSEVKARMAGEQEVEA